MYLRKDILISNSFSYVTVLFPLLRWIKANSIESLTKGEYFFQFKVKLNFFSLVFLVECLFSKVREHKVHLNFRLKEQPSGQAHSFVLFSFFLSIFDQVAFLKIIQDKISFSMWQWILWTWLPVNVPVLWRQYYIMWPYRWTLLLWAWMVWERVHAMYVFIHKG